MALPRVNIFIIFVRAEVDLAGGKMVTYDDKLARIAQLDPTFAGLVFEDGALTVVTTAAPDLSLTTLRSTITSVLGDPPLQ